MTRVGVKSVLVIWALAATLLVGYLSASLENRYLDHHPYFFDAVSYSFYNAKLYQRIQEVGRVEVAYAELANNNRFPLRTVPLVLFAPSMLAHPFGHMATALPAVFAFIFLLAYSIYRIIGRITPAILGSSVVLLLPGLYDPVTGVAAYWLDLPAAFLVGASVLSLLNSNTGRDIGWLILFVFFGSCAAFSRYVSLAFLLFACAPVFVFYLVIRVREDSDKIRAVLLPTFTVLGMGILLAGPYLFYHLESVSEFYHVYGYAVGIPIHQAFKFFLSSLTEFIGTTGLLSILISAVYVTAKMEKKTCSRYALFKLDDYNNPYLFGCYIENICDTYCILCGYLYNNIHIDKCFVCIL